VTAACNKTTLTIDCVALEQNAKHRLIKLRNQGRFLPDGCKFDAMVDCIAPAPYMDDTYSKDNNKIAPFRSEMLSSESEPCSNL
jgi:hypothetical protein